ncbi:AIF_collapsed_G0059130.mRNA.1.CDS.1 [Saccharomyces cerevisiae]|nr:AIF_HP2_G0055520.mRNA.1.CDS.1 [Saccharomyces cerevisiae]CAI6823593.1 AIF_HP2_G0055520.mRNA.1.CDS.1 [Saccharomyces cerevisiae]CAI6838112.1 AIF_HP1_G0056590.mRNA.1.CDS.1 [Saccharomyces cerevisiae]CAI6923215.1 AIF_collapsed_G0059130.mRNA.1.CDS.1 [Saccharomyces cerevisiae]
MESLPRTPTKGRSTQHLSTPSPKNDILAMNGHKRRNTTTPPPKHTLLKPQRTDIHTHSLASQSRISMSPNRELLKNYKGTANLIYGNQKSNSGVTSFYKENVNELNRTQAILFEKKATLDLLKDELTETKEKINAVNLKFETLREEKIKIEQQLNLKNNELISIKEEFLSKKQFMNEGHEIHLKQLAASNKKELKQMENEYKTKIEKLKFMKIKQFENERASLLDKIEEVRNKITMNPSTLQEMLNDVEQKHMLEKEEWLTEYQSQWKKDIELNNKHMQEIESIKKEIENTLKPELAEKKKLLTEKRNAYEAIKVKVKEKEEETTRLRDEVALKQKTNLETLEKIKELEEYIKDTELGMKELNEILIKEETVRRTLHNELQELRGNIRVYCRIRPALKNLENSDTSLINVNEFDDNSGVQSMEVTKIQNTAQVHEFKFDKIFDQQDTNVDVFKEVGQLVQSSLDGYNVCIFAYGQTGSGKTFTMLNPGDGIIPSTISHIFNWINKLKTKGWDYKVNCEFIEIYNENIVDLLRSDNNNKEDTSIGLKHEIRHDQETKTTTITNVTSCKLESEEMVEIILKKANKLRSTASTASNEHSSRSHSIFIIHLSGSNAKTGAHSYGTLNLVDLAGSERINVSQVVGDRLRETQNINKSLSCLGDVIHALGQPDSTKRHIPFRNSKLTYLLQYSLTGDSKTLMFVNISPSSSHINETLNSLRFASKVNSTRLVSRK